MTAAIRSLAGDLRWFACPVCHGRLELRGEAVLCIGCGRAYPVVDGIPVLLAERAVNDGKM